MYTIQFERKARYNSTIHITVCKDEIIVVRYTTNGGYLMEIAERTLKGKEPKIDFDYKTGDVLIHMTREQYDVIMAMIYASQMKKYDLLKAYYHKPSPELLENISILCISRRLFTLEFMYLISILSYMDIEFYSISQKEPGKTRSGWRIYPIQRRIINTLTYGRDPVQNEEILGMHIRSTYELTEAEWEFLHELEEADDKDKILHQLDSIMKRLGHEKEWIAVNIMSLESNE
jgi:hypothetical protein